MQIIQKNQLIHFREEGVLGKEWSPTQQSETGKGYYFPSFYVSPERRECSKKREQHGQRPFIWHFQMREMVKQAQNSSGAEILLSCVYRNQTV